MPGLTLYAIQERKISELVDQYGDNVSVNISELARLNKVPYQRLRNRLQHRHQQFKHGQWASNALLSPSQEAGLLQYIDFLDIRANKVRCTEAVASANRLLYNAGSTKQVGEHWLHHFLARNQDLIVRKQKPLAVARKNAHNIPEMLKRFKEYRALRAEYDILDEDTWNMDETGFRIGVGRPQYIITRDKHRKLTIADPENREFLTSVEAVNAAGGTMPPYIIMSARQYLEKWFEVDTLDPKTSIDKSDTGYSNDDIAMDYLEHFNDNAPAKGAWRMLICDGHGSHSHEEFAKRCDELQIIVLQLLPHTTHVCQPLDVVCFQPLKHYHGQAIDRAARFYSDVTFNKVEFLHSYADVRKQTFTKSTVKSSFLKTGLVPYNPDIVLDKIRAEIAESATGNLPISPEKRAAIDTTLLHTPTGSTNDFLSKYVIFDNYLKSCLQDPTADNLKKLPEIYGKLSKGVAAQLHASALAQDNIERVHREAAARNARSTSNKRISHSGRLTVANARKRIRVRSMMEQAAKDKKEETETTR